VRTEVLPATISIYKKATENGLTQIFIDAGAVVGPPTCGACCGAQMGVLAKDEVCVSTTNRNFPRQKNPKAVRKQSQKYFHDIIGLPKLRVRK